MRWSLAGRLILVGAILVAILCLFLPPPEQEPEEARPQRVEQLGQDRWNQKKLPEITMSEDVERGFAGLARYEVVPCDGGYAVRERP